VLPLHGKPGTDYVLIARAETGGRVYAELLADLEGALRQVARSNAAGTARRGEG
jgi:ribonuclease P protein component